MLMKIFPLLLALILISGCNYRRKKTVNFNIGDTSGNISVLPEDKDSILIQDYPEKIKETKGEIRRILKYHREFKTKFIQHPNISYQLDRATAKDGHVRDFSSEVGQDNYYMYYAYFLKTQNGDAKYQTQRKTLTDIYLGINSIFQKLAQGGTYFGHQYSRIAGYAEYAIYQGANNDYYLKNYNIIKQKTWYIISLKQKITDELNSNDDIYPKDKIKLKKELFETVNKIDRLITNYFYLKMAQGFQYSNY